MTQRPIRVDNTRLERQVQPRRTNRIETADRGSVLVVALIADRVQIDAIAHLLDPEPCLGRQSLDVPDRRLPFRDVERHDCKILDEPLGREPGQNLWMRGELDDQLTYERVALSKRGKRYPISLEDRRARFR